MVMFFNAVTPFSLSGVFNGIKNFIHDSSEQYKVMKSTVIVTAMQLCALIASFGAQGQTVPAANRKSAEVREGTLRVLSFGLGAPLPGPPVDDLYGRDAVFSADAIKRAGSAWREVKTIAISGLDCTPTRLRKELKKLEESVAPTDFVIVHASTHGVTEDKLFRLEGDQKVIDANILAASLARLSCPSLVSIDACQAGGAVHSPLPAKSAWLLGSKETQSTSGQVDDSTVPHGFQVLALCEALRGDADSDRDDLITVGELCAWVPPRATFLARFSCYQDSVVVLPSELAAIPLTRVTPGEYKPLWTMRKVESRNPWGIADVTDLAKDAESAEKLMADLKARADKGKAWVGSEGIAKAVAEGAEKGFQGVWVSRRGANDAEQLENQGRVEILATGSTFFAVVLDPTGSYLIEAVRDPADLNRLSGRWNPIDSPEPSSRWEGRIVDSRRIDGQAPGVAWDFRR
jgi:hypothetical protein